MMKSFLRSILVIAGLSGPTAACCSDLSGTWTLSIENPEHRVVTTLKVEFTNKHAASCMSGKWKVVKVVSTTAKEKDFFPASDPLSYQIENGQLTIGRNEICDAYLWLQASLGGPTVQGDYFSLGQGVAIHLVTSNWSKPNDRNTQQRIQADAHTAHRLTPAVKGYEVLDA